MFIDRRIKYFDVHCIKYFREWLRGMIQISKNSKCLTMKGKNYLPCSLRVITKIQGMKLNNRKCSLWIYKVSPVVISIKLWNGLTMEVAEKPSCKSFHTRVDKVFKDILWKEIYPTAMMEGIMNDPQEFSISVFRSITTFTEHLSSSFIASILSLLFQYLLNFIFLKAYSL